MTTFSNFADRAAAAFAAVGMTAFLLIASFSTPSAQVVAGLMA